MEPQINADGLFSGSVPADRETYNIYLRASALASA